MRNHAAGVTGQDWRIELGFEDINDMRGESDDGIGLLTLKLIYII